MPDANFILVVRDFKVRSRFLHSSSQYGYREEPREHSEYVTVEQNAKAPSLEAMFGLASMMADRFAAKQGESSSYSYSFRSSIDIWTVLDVEIWEDGFLLAKRSDDFTVVEKEAL